jgi:hypothetical protein
VGRRVKVDVNLQSSKILAVRVGSGTTFKLKITTRRDTIIDHELENYIAPWPIRYATTKAEP